MTRKDATNMFKALMVLMLLVPSLGAAQSSEVSTTSPAASAPKEKPFRARVGLFGGMVMQKPQFEVALAWDFARLTDRLRLVADVTVGLRPNELTLEPMVGVRLPIELKKLPKMEPWVGALLGANFTFMRGGTALSLPLRLAAGLHYEVVTNLSLGLELSAEFGPLVAPFAAGYAAMHIGAVAAWAF